MLNKTRKTLIFSLIVFLFIAYIYANNYDEKIEETESKIENLQKNMKKLHILEKEEKEKLSAYEKEYFETQEKITKQLEVIEDVKKKIEAKNNEIEIRSKELVKVQEEIMLQNDYLKKRLRAMYKFGKVGQIEILLKANDFMEAMTRLDRIKIIADFDKKLLQNLKDTRKKRQEAKDLVLKEQEKLEDLKDELFDEKENLELTLKREEVKKQHSKNTIEDIKRRKALYETEAKQLDELLRKFISEKNYVGGVMSWPLDLHQNYITSFFGKRAAPIAGASTNHGAIDVGVRIGEPVYASLDGTIIYASYYGSYGNMVMIDHGGGIVTVYAHLSNILKSAGTNVKRGETLALSGNTGVSTGPHLHFEVRVNGVRVDPLDYVSIP